MKSFACILAMCSVALPPALPGWAQQAVRPSEHRPQTGTHEYEVRVTRDEQTVIRRHQITDHRESSVQFQMVPGSDVSRYWVGAQFERVPSSLLSRLRLPSGLIVEAIAPRSPAHQAGVRVHDIVLQIDEQNVSSPRQLVGHIQQAQEEVVELKLLRGGQIKQLSIKPEVRFPRDVAATVVVDHRQTGELAQLKALKLWLDKIDQNSEATGRFRMLMVRPGVVVRDRQAHVTLAPEGTYRARLPENRLIKLVRKADGDTLIEVHENGKQIVHTAAQDVPNLPVKIQPLIISELSKLESVVGDIQINGTPVRLFSTSHGLHGNHRFSFVKPESSEHLHQRVQVLPMHNHFRVDRIRIDGHTVTARKLTSDASVEDLLLQIEKLKKHNLHLEREVDRLQIELNVFKSDEQIQHDPPKAP